MSANDNAARPTYFQTKSGAEQYAKRLAQAESPTRLATGVPFVRGLMRAVEGGKAFEAKQGHLDEFFVREVPEAEIARRTQAGMRAEVERLYEKAASCDLLAEGTRMQNLLTFYEREAASHRRQARDIEVHITVSEARSGGDLPTFDEPITSSERDSRHAEAR